jgi:alpha-L-fucosidase 2
MQAVHEMLLQSWSPTPGRRDGEIIRIFPAMPWRWHEASFDDLRAEGGWRVSARRENDATTRLKISATRNGLLRIRDNFNGRTPKWNHAGVEKAGDNFVVALKAGESLVAELEKPESFPPAPDNLASPVKIIKNGTVK